MVSVIREACLDIRAVASSVLAGGVFGFGGGGVDAESGGTGDAGTEGGGTGLTTGAGDKDCVLAGGWLVAPFVQPAPLRKLRMMQPLISKINSLSMIL